MGNGVTKVSHCFASSGDISRRHDIAVHLSDPLHEGLGHSFCYIRPEPARLSSNKIHSEETTTFRSISGASVSANTSTLLSTALSDSSACPVSSGLDRVSSTFESSDSFASLPLQPVPRGQFYSGSVAPSAGSGPIERGFLSGPIERGFQSGPIDRGLYSGPFEKEKEQEKEKEKESEKSELQRSFSLNGYSTNGNEDKPKKPGLIKTLKRVLSNTITRGQRRLTMPVKGVKELELEGNEGGRRSSVATTSDADGDSEFSLESQNLQWAQGRAGEDRVHVVISEENGWVFVGIYDGFNGPDAPDYLLSNLYANVHKGLKGLLWNDELESSLETEQTGEGFCSVDREKCVNNNDVEHNLKRKDGKNLRYRSRGERKRCFDWQLRQQLNSQGSKSNGVNHLDVLKALSQALKTTEEAFFEEADKMAMENPELALMGSCVLVMLMKGEDVYLMNVGDSRAVLAQKLETNLGLRKSSQDLEMICEESMRDPPEFINGDELCRAESLNSVQLTVDHSTYVEKEVQRIKREHPDDASAVMNDRVKGYLKVTRAFGVGFLKQPKWNELLLEMFRIDYIGTSPYITCVPFLYHHRLSPRDRFLILSSDGLYQYFTSEEAVAEVASFIAAFPEGDPAQHLIEELLFRAARKAGLDFHELLDIPQGDRRRYHDDVSVIIISLEGRIWRSSV
ncbi:hypothetical protein Tsubulata_014896 [Turnera subulata]|uniref:protein-serine/threonine phosphatase n=1 Tax=Turnera subulata TaxID=218843 RepID=A0A9Q0G5Q7_9ROSI|nr:hypothetical protein Tsubulata_014896 [Turnera subulata]